MAPKPRIFTPEALIHIREMATQGSSAFEIAKEVGSTPASIRVVCSKYKIRMRRGRRYVDEMWSPHPAHHAHPKLNHAIVAHLPRPLFVEFYRKAEHLKMPVSLLASSLLEAIASSDIYDAVLDNRE